MILPAIQSQSMFTFKCQTIYFDVTPDTFHNLKSKKEGPVVIQVDIKRKMGMMLLRTYQKLVPSKSDGHWPLSWSVSMWSPCGIWFHRSAQPTPHRAPFRDRLRRGDSKPLRTVPLWSNTRRAVSSSSYLKSENRTTAYSLGVCWNETGIQRACESNTKHRNWWGAFSNLHKQTSGQKGETAPVPVQADGLLPQIQVLFLYFGLTVRHSGNLRAKNPVK